MVKAHFSSCLSPPFLNSSIIWLPAVPRKANHKPSLQSTIRSIKSLAPLLDRVLVQRVKAEAKTASGIFLPESSVKDLNEAKVLAVGPGAMDRDGKRIACSVTPGDKVLIPQVSISLLL